MTAGVRPSLRLADVALRVRATGAALLDGVTLAVGPGEIVSIMGPSGAGKSTLLAFAGGFLDVAAFGAAGSVWLGQDRLDDKPAAVRRLGVLFQDPVLFPHLSVGGNLLFGLPRARHRGRADRRRAVEEALASAGLSGFAARDPASLSGGQKARVALLRTLLAEPRALLLDEPFGRLDAALRGEVRALVFARARERHLPTLLVTHDAADAAAAGGRVYAIVRAGLHPVPSYETAS